MMSPTTGGPRFDELWRGQAFDSAPAITLTSGLAAAHQAIIGDRLRLPLDGELSRLVTGADAPMAHPALVCDVAIGQSTTVTQHVKANLFYRGLVFERFPVIGDTLRTRTEVVGLKQNSTQPGRPRTGLAALRMTTTDQCGRTVLDFYRCAMLPLRDETADTHHRDDLSHIGMAGGGISAASVRDWDGEVFRARVPGPHFRPEQAGTVLHSTADVVSSAPELARLTLNVAAVHHDHRVAGRRLVYGGHTIGLALAQATRLLPNLVAVVSWQSCEHIGPVYEGDTLYSEVRIEAAELTGDGGVLQLRSLVFATGDGVSGADRPVLDWRFSALQF